MKPKITKEIVEKMMNWLGQPSIVFNPQNNTLFVSHGGIRLPPWQQIVISRTDVHDPDMEMLVPMAQSRLDALREMPTPYTFATALGDLIVDCSNTSGTVVSAQVGMSFLEIECDTSWISSNLYNGHFKSKFWIYDNMVYGIRLLPYRPINF